MYISKTISYPVFSNGDNNHYLLNAVQMFHSETQTYPLTLFGVF